jgi:membrane protease YdiL (CAAX protease family)
MEASMQYRRANRKAKSMMPRWQDLSFFFALVMAQFYVYINFKGLGFSREVGLVYIILPGMMLTYYLVFIHQKRRSLNLDDLKLFPMIVYGFLGFIVTWIAVLIIYGKIFNMEFGTIPVTSVWGTILTQVLFVACSEELCFRYILPAYFKGAFHWIIPALISQASFAAFHYSVYGGDLTSLLLAFVMGSIWYFAYHIPVGRSKLGLGFTIGSHAAYNLVLVGVLAGAGHIVTIVGG